MRLATSPILRLVLGFSALLVINATAGEVYPARMERVELDGGAALVVVNDGPTRLSVNAELTNSINISSDKVWPVSESVAPRTRKTLAFLYPSQPNIPSQWDFRASFTLTPGSPQMMPGGARAAPEKDFRARAQEELQRLLAPAAQISLFLSGRPTANEARGGKRSADGLSPKDAEPFLFRAYGLFLSIVLLARLLVLLRYKDWARAGMTLLGLAVVDYGLVRIFGNDLQAFRSWQYDRFIAFFLHHAWSLVVVLCFLGICWTTAHYLLPRPFSRYGYRV